MAKFPIKAMNTLTRLTVYQVLKLGLPKMRWIFVEIHYSTPAKVCGNI
jgi:hypothetical protein